jgi:hypothetical protein
VDYSSRSQFTLLAVIVLAKQFSPLWFSNYASEMPADVKKAPPQENAFHFLPNLLLIAEHQRFRSEGYPGENEHSLAVKSGHARSKFCRNINRSALESSEE